MTQTAFTKGYNDQYPGCEMVPMTDAAGNAIVAVNLVKNDEPQEDA